MDNDIFITPGEPEDNQGPIKFEPLGFHRVPTPELTDRAKLAMKIYQDHLSVMGGITDGDMKESYNHAMKAANYFFDQLEKGNE